MAGHDRDPAANRTLLSERGTFWPLRSEWALIAVPLVAIVLFAAFALARTNAGWPPARSDNMVLVAILAVSLLPLVLVVLDVLAARGGALEVRGVKIDFASRLAKRSELTVAPNIGVPGVSIPDSNSEEILDTLRAAVASEIVVIDLEDGSAWWETRLLVLCSGAVRLGQPAAIVFVATEQGKRRRFQGWAPPQPLLQSLLRADRRYRDSFWAARAAVSQWSATVPWEPGQPSPGLPAGATGLAANHSFVMFSATGERNEHAEEQFLAVDLAAKAEPPQSGISVIRLKDLFAAALVTGVIDRGWSADRRIDAALDSDASYTAVTEDGEYLGLLSRADAQAAVLGALVANVRVPAAEGGG